MFDMIKKKPAPRPIASAQAVANCFILLARSELKLLTNLRLQKMVFIAHGFSLALLDRPLFRNKVMAGEFGPVIPELYDALVGYGSGPVTNIIHCSDVLNPKSEKREIIASVYETYAQHTDAQLFDLLREPGTAWDVTYRKNPEGVIPPPLIQQTYKDTIAKREAAERQLPASAAA